MTFNVLRDPWIPLDAGGETRMVPYPDVLTGAADAPDLRHPRDDLRFYARMLLSALTQALFPARDARELEQRLRAPLPVDVVSARIDEVADDFELLGGPRPFLQEPEPPDGECCTDRLFLDVPSGSEHLLFRPAQAYDCLCPACALVATYGAQAFAPSGGRGYSPGVRGAPPVTTMVRAETVHQTVWANTLASDTAAALSFAKDDERPWSSGRREKAGESIGLVEGLFWQPRHLVLSEADSGPCCACGAIGTRVRAFNFGPKSKVAGGFYRHPLSPAREDRSAKAKRPWRPVYLPGDRPVWTGLADMLPAMRGGDDGAPQGELSHAAPVVEQWLSSLGYRSVTLLVFAYQTNKAKVRGRISDELAISLQVDGDIAQEIEFLVEKAEGALGALFIALKRAHSTNRKDKGGYFKDEARVEFWRRSEPEFWAALEALQREGDATDAYLGALRNLAVALYDEHTEPSSLDNSKQALVARARRGLRRELAERLPISPEVNDAR